MWKQQDVHVSAFKKGPSQDAVRFNRRLWVPDKITFLQMFHNIFPLTLHSDLWHPDNKEPLKNDLIHKSFRNGLKQTPDLISRKAEMSWLIWTGLNTFLMPHSQTGKSNWFLDARNPINFSAVNSH